VTVDPLRPAFDAYAVLGVLPSATRDQVHHAYRELARRFHPDTNSDPAAAVRFAEVHAAWEVLGNDERRRTYDLLHGGLRGARAARTAPGPTGNTAVRGMDARPSHRPREREHERAPAVRETDELRVFKRLAVAIVIAIVLFVVGLAILSIGKAPTCDGQRPFPCRVPEPGASSGG
jgi:curved DNA-binding protein CbpA